MKYHGLIACFLLLLLNACQSELSEDVNQDRIWTNYELFYDQESDKTLAIAVFRFGNALGTRLELSGAADITFNNQDMVWKVGLARYELEFDGWVKDGTFVYTDAEENTFTNVLPTMRSAIFPDNPTVIALSKSEDYTLAWEGTPLAEEDVLSVRIEDLWEVEWSDNDTEIIITKGKIRNLDNGDYLMYMHRSILDEDIPEATSAGGFINVHYRAAKKNCTVTD